MTILNDGFCKHEKVSVHKYHPVGKIMAADFEKETITVEITLPAYYFKKIPTAEDVCGILKDD